MSDQFAGVLAPFPTPTTDTDAVAYDRIADVVDYTVTCGCDGLIAAGTGVQETAALTPDERTRIITETLEVVPDDLPVVAGATHPSVDIATNLIAHAESEGADGVIVMPPWGGTPTQDDIVDYFDVVAAETSVPFFAYNSPSVTTPMTLETMRRVARIHGVTHVKETSRDWNRVSWLLERVHHEGHASVFATMDVLLSTLQAGGGGAVVPPPTCGLSKRIADMYERGNLNTATDIQRTFGTFPPDEAADIGLTDVVKLAMKYDGTPVGRPRYRRRPYPEAVKNAVERWVETVGPDSGLPSTTDD